LSGGLCLELSSTYTVKGEVGTGEQVCEGPEEERENKNTKTWGKK
jgi:hypothetical protein